MARTLEKVLAELESLISGHTDRKEEARILNLLTEIEAAQLNEVLLRVDLGDLIESLDDRSIGPDNRTELYNLLTVRRLAELQVGARIAFVNALQKGPTTRHKERAISSIFLGTGGSDLTTVKNGIDAGDDYRDLQQLLFTDVDNHDIREGILSHIQREAADNRRSSVRALSDIDDTFYANLKDPRYPKGTTYPGVIRYYRELVEGPDETADDRGTLVFLTARPKDRLGVVEGHSKRALRRRGLEEDFTVLSGDFLHLVGNSEIAEKKYANFVQYRQLFPEYGFVFTGDSGQGDAVFGAKIRADFPEDVRGVFIHDVISHSQNERETWRSKGVVFFDTYVGAAVEAHRAGLISRDGVQRVIGAAREELQAVPFGDAQQKQLREAELEKDIASASELA